MKYEMVMPKLGESITEGTIIKWLKSVGDTVVKDETILEISTDKVDSEIPATHSGVLIEILVSEGDVVDVEKVIAVIESDESPDSGGVEEKYSEPLDIPEPSNKVGETIKLKSDQAANRFYSPLVLNIASQNGVTVAELNKIIGRGVNGRVRKQDMLAYLDKRINITNVNSDADEIVEIIPMNHIRKSIAKHMIQSKQTSAHVHLYTEVDMHNVYKIRERKKAGFKKDKGYSLSYMPFITEATVKALKDFPLLNASIDGDSIIIKKFYHVGIAVARDEGLIVPNLYHADKYSLSELAFLINDLSIRARNKKIKPDEVLNGTFSISNFGVYGTTIGFPIINQPQSAILGVGALKKRPLVIHDAIAIRPVLYLALTIDHRLIDGAMGAQFLENIKENLEGYEPDLVM